MVGTLTSSSPIDKVDHLAVEERRRPVAGGRYHRNWLMPNSKKRVPD
ncbi:hypothetical protein COLO4_30745 [Corchorus olitorius]|uniref:Uncharacterized protein n=1 Tax=Corchorus olitorius TaxID=93759 RepID=A0A1R3H785_9ROSI|nr:hypothetical protein COLO4_30745 [Corchorus olitorius]